MTKFEIVCMNMKENTILVDAKSKREAAAKARKLHSGIQIIAIKEKGARHANA